MVVSRGRISCRSVWNLLGICSVRQGEMVNAEK